jgi:hypothetical protein
VSFRHYSAIANKIDQITYRNFTPILFDFLLLFLVNRCTVVNCEKTMRNLGLITVSKRQECTRGGSGLTLTGSVKSVAPSRRGRDVALRRQRVVVVELART